MVKLIPVLVANSVSRNIVPGILKAIERHAIIYDLDMILDQAAKDLKISSAKRRNKKVIFTETDDQIVEFLRKEFIGEQYNPKGRFGSGTKGKKGPYQDPIQASAKERDRLQSEKDREERQRTSRAADRLTPEEEREIARQRQLGKQDAEGPPEFATKADELKWKEKEATAKEAGKRAGQAGDATVSIGQFDMKSIQLEPSWMKADLVTKNRTKFSTLIGVKAIPIAVKSDAKLHELIMWDAQIGRLMQMIVRWGRGVEGYLYRLWARTIGRITNPDPDAISGNPYKDIVLRRTIISSKYVNNIYFVLNRADLQSDFFEQAKRVRQLVRLGWQSFVIADDVNRSVSFCMLKFRGMCSTMPYSMLYQTLDQAKVFDDLEDVRRSSASLFKTKKQFKKIIGESLADKKLEEFAAEVFKDPPEYELLNEMEILNERFGELVKKIAASPKAAVSRFLKKSIKIPSLPPRKLAKMANKIDPDFFKAFELSRRVLSNSLSSITNQTLIDWAALTIVIKGFTLKAGKGLIYGTKEALKYLVPKIRESLKKAKESTLKIPPEHMFQVIFGTFMLGAIGWLIGFLMVKMIRNSYEIADHIVQAFQGATNSFKIFKSKIEGTINKMGVDPEVAEGAIEGGKDAAKSLIKKGSLKGGEMVESGQEIAVFIGILMIGAGVIMAGIATLKER